MQDVYRFPLYSLICECAFEYTVIFHVCTRYTTLSKIAPGITCVSSIAARELSSESGPEEKAWGAVKVWRVKNLHFMHQQKTYLSGNVCPPEGHL